ncbi:MAG: DNA internalization-related competence protein ComEC/Rec2 [Oscillospiraceae bacterium]|nr:DNA internalization-related competence protein ComEC/Rec2 [Oscillospiraceae bacterium]
MRKLAIASGAFSFATILAHYLLPGAWRFPLALGLALSGIGLLLPERCWLQPLVIALCALAAGLYVYGMRDMLVKETVHGLDGAEWEASARILTAPMEYDDYIRTEILLPTEQGKALRTILYDRSFAIQNAAVGDEVFGRFRVHAADQRYGETYDSYFARGVYLTAGNVGVLSLVKSARPPLTARPARLSHTITEQIARVFPEDTAAFFRGLLLGDKAELYADSGMYYAMSRSGFMHIVAVSGMHIAFLISMLNALMGKTRRSALLSLLLIWLYVFLIGSSPSALRAAIMLSITQMAPILRRENDPPTTLLFALAILLAINPFSAASVSLQLSFAAIAGIMLFAEGINRRVLEALPHAMHHRLRSYLASNISSSLSVLVFSIPLIGVYFGYVSLLSPLVNLLALWAVPICFGGGLASCLGAFAYLPAAKALAWLISFFARYILLVAKSCAKLNFSCLYLSLPVNRIWLILAFSLVLVMAKARLAYWKKWFYSSMLLAASLFLLLTATRLYYGNAAGYLSVLDVGQGQSVVMFSGEDTIVVDCGNTGSLDKAGSVTGTYLKSRCRDDVDLLVLTHLHTDHADGVVELMEYLPIRKLVIGYQMDDPAVLLPEIQRAAQEHGVQLEILQRDQVFSFDGLSASVFVPALEGDVNERCLTARIDVQDTRVLVTGDIDMEAERELLRRRPIRQVDWLIVGHHGSKKASSPELLSEIGAKQAVISCGYNNYGHPAKETLERLKKYGYTVYRTDEDGTVEIRLS